MDLKGRMAIAIFLLFGLLFAFLMGLTALLETLGYLHGISIIMISVIFAVFVLLLQWGLSPYIVMWLYKIEWVEPEYFGQNIANFIRSKCAEKGINIPRCGIIGDGNPNAFTFGWTKNRAYLVLTSGIFTYCDEEEVKSVVAHELGHIVNNDFVVMTVIAAIPLILYVIYRGCLRTLRYGRIGGSGRGRGNVLLFILITMVLSYIAYVISNLIALYFGRLREYYADRFSAIETRNPNALATALIKIAYGMASVEKQQRLARPTSYTSSSTSYHHRAYRGGKEKSLGKSYLHENTLGIFNLASARALASMAATRSGEISIENMKKAMAWDLWNPWAFFLELQMTHPLPAKRILALGRLAEQTGQIPLITFDIKQPETYWDDFLRDIFMKYLCIVGGVGSFIISYFLLNIPLISSVGLALIIAGLCGLIFVLGYKYPSGFRDTTVENLIINPKASPIRGIPVRLKGRIVGRGNPGYYFSEDLKIDDGTGLLLIDYNQIIRIIDFLASILWTPYQVGKTVIVEGWYHREVIPYLNLFAIYSRGERLGRVYAREILAGVCIIFLVIGLLILFAFSSYYGPTFPG